MELNAGLQALGVPPSLMVADTIDPASYALPIAIAIAIAGAGAAWSASITANDNDGTLFYWQLVQAPAGVTLTPSGTLLPQILARPTPSATAHKPHSAGHPPRVTNSQAGSVLLRNIMLLKRTDRSQ